MDLIDQLLPIPCTPLDTQKQCTRGSDSILVLLGLLMLLVSLLRVFVIWAFMRNVIPQIIISGVPSTNRACP